MFTVVLLATTIIAQATPKLSWETQNPNAREWTAVALGEIEKHFPILDTAGDIETFCPQYKKLDLGQRLHLWGELFAALAMYESNWNPHCQYTEVTLGIDSVTGKPLVSEGLLQLSYTDTRWAKWCQFDWEHDKIQKTFQTVTILDPKRNLVCGIGIMANQIKKRNAIVLDRGAYWSTLKSSHQRNKIKEIGWMLRTRIPQCK